MAFRDAQRVMPQFLCNEDGELVNVASEETLLEVGSALADIETVVATDATLASVADAVSDLAAVAATQTTLAALTATVATQATLATRASEATLATLGTQATLATRASESTLATRATEATLASVLTRLNQFLLDADGVLYTRPREKPTFTVAATGVALGNGKSLLSLVNGSSSVVRLINLSLRNVQTSATAGVAAEFHLRRCAGHSVGTALIPQAHDTAQVLAGSITARSGATIAGESATFIDRALWSTDEWGPGTPDTESTDHAFQSIGPQWQWARMVLRNGEGITVRCHTNTTNGTFDAVATFQVE